MSDSLKTLYDSMSARLLNANALWDGRVFPDFIPPNEDLPSIRFSRTAGGELNRSRKKSKEYLIDVIIITSNQKKQTGAAEKAMAGAGFINDLVDDQGSQDVDDQGQPTERAITGDENWVITTITQGSRIHFVDNWSTNGVAIYHSGHEYMIRMEELS